MARTIIDSVLAPLTSRLCIGVRRCKTILAGLSLLESNFNTNKCAAEVDQGLTDTTTLSPERLGAHLPHAAPGKYDRRPSGQLEKCYDIASDHLQYGANNTGRPLPENLREIPFQLEGRCPELLGLRRLVRLHIQTKQVLPQGPYYSFKPDRCIWSDFYRQNHLEL